MSNIYVTIASVEKKGLVEALEQVKYHDNVIMHKHEKPETSIKRQINHRKMVDDEKFIVFDPWRNIRKEYRYNETTGELKDTIMNSEYDAIKITGTPNEVSKIVYDQTLKGDSVNDFYNEIFNKLSFSLRIAANTGHNKALEKVKANVEEYLDRVVTD